MGTHNVQKHVVKHTLKLKNIRVYYFLQKTSMSINMSEEGQFKNAKCVHTKVSKTPDTSSIQLKKKKKKNVHYRSSVFVKRFGPCHQFQ